MTFLLTEYGHPFSAAGFGNWFRTQCDLAGLPHCTAHGLRKAAARRMAEAGCTNQQIKSITGHKTDKEVARYTAAADQIRLSDQAIEALAGSESERKNG
jgi:integrase